MDFGIAGKVALVTGGGRGIGKAIAEALAGEGCAVAVADIDTATAASTACDLTDRGAKATALTIDVGDRRSVERGFAEAAHFLGSLDILINNAGIVKVGPLADGTDADWEQVSRINTDGVLYCSRCAVGYMQPRGWGRIVNISSISALKGGGVVGNAFYGVTKAAVAALTLAFAKEYGPRGINVNAVVPGPVSSNMTLDHIPDEAAHRRIVDRIPVGRFGVPQDVANVVTFLASNATGFMNGSLVLVDGGITLT